MKKLKTLITSITLFISTISFAQDYEWNNRILFNRVYENNQMLSNFKMDEDVHTDVFGKESFINNNNEKIFELVKYDSKKDQMLPYLTGAIDNLKTERSFRRDSATFINKMAFTWHVKNIENNSIRKASVYETTIMDQIGRQIITTVHIKFHDSNREMYCWGEEDFSDPSSNDIVLPQMFKVKRISVPTDNEYGMKDINDPEEKVNYAFWTKNGFYRYAKNGIKDKIEFKKLNDSIKEGNVSMLIYNDVNGEERLYTNTYMGDNTTYVSTLDITPFPVYSDHPVIPLETVIVWEKFSITKEYFNMIIKLEFIGENGLSEKEINNMSGKVKCLEQLTEDFNDQNKS